MGDADESSSILQPFEIQTLKYYRRKGKQLPAIDSYMDGAVLIDEMYDNTSP